MVSIRTMAARVILPVAVLAGAAALLTPGQAQAWWRRGVWIEGPAFVVAPPVVVAPAPVVVGPPPVVVVPRPYARWIPAHYNRWGYYVPGHWA